MSVDLRGAARMGVLGALITTEWAADAAKIRAKVMPAVYEAVDQAVEHERAGWVAKIETLIKEIETGLTFDGHLLTSNDRKVQRHTLTILRALLPDEENW